MTKVREVSSMNKVDKAPGVFNVKGQHGDYVTIVRGESKTCTCPDFMYRGFHGRLCKHINAAVLVVEAEQEAFRVMNTVQPVPEELKQKKHRTPPPEPTLRHETDGSLWVGDRPIKSFEDFEAVRFELGLV